MSKQQDAQPSPFPAVPWSKLEAIPAIPELIRGAYLLHRPPTVRIVRQTRLGLYAVVLFSVVAAAIFSSAREMQAMSEAQGRLSVLATSVEDSVVTNFQSRKFDRISRIVSKFKDQQRILALVICSERSIGFPRGSNWESLCGSPRVAEVAAGQGPAQWGQSDLHARNIYFAMRLDSLQARAPAVLLLVQDVAPLRAQWLTTFAQSTGALLGCGLLLLGLVTLQLRRSIRIYVRVLNHMIRTLLSGRRPALSPRILGDSPELAPISNALSALANRIIPFPDRSRAHPRDSGWLASLRQQMGGRKLVVLANREPYIHEKRPAPAGEAAPETLQIVRPASGLVTALEPILRNCGGLWIGHGSGSADRETVNAEDEVRVPPEDPTYTLKRVWLSRAEEEGYYYGFSNEGLWPLCHLAHNRPIFRLSDWQQYTEVNRKFSEAVPLAQLRNESLILVQDYHFALAPRMIRERASQRRTPRIGLFWHIPWPNPEAFGICPWHQELLKGMLGADVIGFHTQYHCNNFLETCNRYLEARVDLETFSVTMGDHQTAVRAIPIGIETEEVAALTASQITALKAQYGIHADIVAVGVDRMDYTKGLVERLQGVERFLEKNPSYIGRFCFAQIGSPSRATIAAYQALAAEIKTLVARINERFGPAAAGPEVSPDYRPVVFLNKHHDWHEIQKFYQLGDVCLVTSLHDGMNLVAKEYVWCQRPDRGALILSRFTGASRELTEAILVNPYCIEEMADAIAQAVSLPPQERHRRMAALRRKVESRDAFHWASDLIEALVPREDRHLSRLKAL